MNKRTYLLLPLVAVVAACTAPGDTKDGISMRGQCSSQPKATCKPNDMDSEAFIRVNEISGVNPHVTPATVCAEGGMAITFSIQPPRGQPAPESGSVTLVPKNLGDLWMLATNDGDDPTKIVVEIPQGLDGDEYYGYGILSKKYGCTDPYIHLK
jgi:hypothetical protein